ncbi:MAG: hypothetical protein ACOYM3_14300 [Terrimicrobiaceae bacterium]
MKQVLRENGHADDFLLRPTSGEGYWSDWFYRSEFKDRLPASAREAAQGRN